MIHLRTRLRTCKGVVWNGTNEAVAEIMALTTCSVSIARSAGGACELQLVTESGADPVRLMPGEVVIVGEDQTIGIWSRAQLEATFEPVAVP